MRQLFVTPSMLPLVCARNRASKVPVGTAWFDAENSFTCELRGINEEDKVPNLVEAKVLWTLVFFTNLFVGRAQVHPFWPFH